MTITLTKVQGGANTHVVVCSHDRDGGSQLEQDTVITRESPDGYVWTTAQITGMLDKVVSVQIDPAGTARHLNYTLKADRGSVVEPLDGDTESAPAQPSASSVQCLVRSTRYFPRLRLNCGDSDRYQVSRVEEGFLADCPLIAGDRVTVYVDEKTRKTQIVGRASGGEWCNRTIQPGRYSAPCGAEKQDNRSSTVKTLFFQGRKMVRWVIPKECKTVSLEPGIYRVIRVHNTSGGGQPSVIETREAGLRLEGESLSGQWTPLPEIFER